MPSDPLSVPATGPRGRGTGLNPANRFDRIELEVLEPPEDARGPRTSSVGDRSRRVINRVDSPDLSFNWTLNPYRGCEHGCTYCYARPTHELLGYSCGLDFESVIVAKRDAPQQLRRELADPRWAGEPIVLSGVTDPYQPLERRLRITRRCLELCAACRQPVSLVTKSRMITRDLDLLADLARHDAVNAAISLTTLDPALSRAMEPRASRPADRLAAIRQLADAGVPVMVMLAPIVPGLTDREIPALLQAAADAGARSAAWVMLRLPHQVSTLFVDWLRRQFPDGADRIERMIRDTQGGALYRSRFGQRQRGTGPLAAQIRSVFKLYARRTGLDRPLPAPSSAGFRRPTLDGQLPLFGG